jgi:hypothetical protein
VFRSKRSIYLNVVWLEVQSSFSTILSRSSGIRWESGCFKKSCGLLPRIKVRDDEGESAAKGRGNGRSLVPQESNIEYGLRMISGRSDHLIRRIVPATDVLMFAMHWQVLTASSDKVM